MSDRLARVAAAVLTLAAGAVSLVTAGSPAAAQPRSIFGATASAEGVRMALQATGAPVATQPLDVATPVAQVSFDSTTGSAALASVAYPGDLVVTAPGLISGLTGGQTSGVIPEYPAIVVAGSTTKPENRINVPGASMVATGDTKGVDAIALAGPGAAVGGTGTLSTEAKATLGDDATVTVSSSAITTSLGFGPLAVGRYTASASATRAPGGEVRRASSFAVEGLTIVGVGVALGSHGLVLAGTATPISTSALQPVLDAAGISVQSLAAEETKDGVVSAGLVVRRTQMLPAAISDATVAYTLGRATVSVANVASGDAVVVDAGGLPPSVVATGGVASFKASGPAAVATVGRPYLATPTRRVRVTRARPAEFFDLGTVYVVLLVGAGCAALVLELLRHRGVRMSWT